MKKIILPAIGALLLPLLLLLLADRSIPAQYGESFLGGMDIKLARARQAASPKILLVGGSSLAFGADSAAIGEKTGYDTVNFGLYAALGTVYMAEQSKAVMEEGDIILLCPETSQQTMSLYFGGESAWQAAEVRPETLLRVRPVDYPALTAAFPAYLSGKYRLWQTGGIRGGGVYRKSSFDENGDMAYVRETNIMTGGYDPNTPIALTPALADEEFLEYVNGYVRYSERKGAKVYYAFPPMNRLAVTSDEEEMYAFFLAMQEGLDCEIITSPEDCILHEKLFYDSNFHLTDRGREVYSAVLANALYRVLGIRQLISLPDTGDIQELDLFVQEETTQAEGFVTWESADGVTVVGVTEEIRRLASITVPAVIGEKPVTVIAGGAFSDCESLESITLPAGITRIDDGAFAGCSALREIVVRNRDAASVTVGEGLLEGTEDVKIRVRKEAYANFVADYFWSPYSGRMEVME